MTLQTTSTRTRIIHGHLFVAALIFGNILAASAQSPAPAFYVAPYGLSSGDGSVDHPWDLATALAAPATVVPGSTIWVREGVYQGRFTSKLKGTALAPIVVRQYLRERATIDRAGLGEGSTLEIKGVHTTWWGLEVMNSNPRRVTQTAGSHPDDLRRGDGVAVYAANTKLINLVVHDNAEGIAFWTPAVNSEITGLLTYNNGWWGPDRGHGHGIYIQNQTGTKLIRDVISFNNFSTGMKAYAQATYAVGITFDGIMSFNNGEPAAQPISNLFVGTISNPADLITVKNSYLYHSQSSSVDLDATLSLGYKGLNKRLTVTNNYVAGRDSISLKNWSDVTLTGNVFYGPTEHFTPSQYPANTFTEQRPTGVKAFVRPNPYEAGRAHLAIFNWDNAGSVAVDLSGAGLTVGAGYELRDAQNYYGQPVKSWTYNGQPVAIPMNQLTIDPVIGNSPVQPAHTAPEFAVFVIVPTVQGQPPVEPPPPVVAPPPPPVVAPPPPAPPVDPPAPAACSTMSLKVSTWPTGGRVGIRKSFFAYPSGHVAPATLTAQFVGDDQSKVTVTTIRPSGSVAIRLAPTQPGTFPLMLTLVDANGCVKALTGPRLIKVSP